MFDINNRLDYWSIRNNLEKMYDYFTEGYFERLKGDYKYEYEDLIFELSGFASEMWDELDALVDRIDREMPYKFLEFYEDDVSSTAVSWWNTAACMLTDIDMEWLIENERGLEESFDLYKEKQKRLSALRRLTKNQQMQLYTYVIGFVFRYLELKMAFDMIIGLIGELEHHRAFENKKGELQPPQSAYL